ncbi:MAG TPA: 1-(5-phosphoribosyl)-5-[(5-phosphoribosylamino)methylideneamino]imidazole-4-carboxamide isomerase [Candidatus Omnitrophica bacterium]|nr:1-(5-phosphoribosyl)-5-[(5-phosphoribosylamino)methylideneamino]imidazole-4-carboxamide isomerase [Candidatus Omnitrophota bacterium]
MLIIPAIDLMEGKVVRLTKGDFTNKKIYSDDPVKVAREWEDRGARRIHIVDLDGAMTGISGNMEVIKRIVNSLNISVEVGGGVRNFVMVERFFDCGTQYVILGTKGLKDEGFLETCLFRFPHRIILSLDIKDRKISIKGWREDLQEDIFSYFKRLKGLKLDSIIVTDIQRDGTLEGLDIDLFSEICKKSPLPVIVSGGVSSLKDIESLSSISKLKGVIIGKALYEGRIDLEEVLKFQI